MSVVAPDLSLTLVQNNSGSLTPQITSDGVSVDATSLTIVTQAGAGTASAALPRLNYTPSQGFSGSDSFQYQGTATIDGSELTSNVANVTVTVNTPCCELGRVTRCYVSAYQRNRIHESQCFSQEKRCLVANYNGALPKSRKVVSVVWSCLNPTLANMLQCEIDPNQRETAVVILFQYGGISLIRCAATLDSGEVMVQMFRLIVGQVAWFQGDQPFTNGPYTLTATV